jgi:hypothetical protein
MAKPDRDFKGVPAPDNSVYGLNQPKKKKKRPPISSKSAEDQAYEKSIAKVKKANGSGHMNKG